MKLKAKKPGFIIVVGVLALLLILAGAFLIYTAIYYHADSSAVEAVGLAGDVSITSSDGALIFDPGSADTALVFYPGGKVEYTAYEPLMVKLAEKGILCILPKMPFNLAVFGVNAADKYISSHTEIKHWYLGGHSLGGSMAASYASKNADKVEGLVLLASYSAADISESGIKALFLCGSKDGILSAEDYQSHRKNLPADTEESVITDGNHAGFGCYGPQKGDGEAGITAEKQQSETADAVADFCLSAEKAA